MTQITFYVAPGSPTTAIRISNGYETRRGTDMRTRNSKEELAPKKSALANLRFVRLYTSSLFFLFFVGCISLLPYKSPTNCFSNFSFCTVTITGLDAAKIVFDAILIGCGPYRSIYIRVI